MINGIQTTSDYIKDKKDIAELEDKIQQFRQGEMDEERFKQFRLTRGVYGQRQLGVHMFRTKLPMGLMTSRQLYTLAEVSEKYATGNLHLTTRQNIQFHYVKLEDSAKIWDQMAEAGMNAREACGNTVRNVTCSPMAGIDPEEPFDVSPYAHALYNHFLRNPICQEMGRKIKIAFSSSYLDTAFCYFHDFGFIPRIQDGKRGFQVLIGGGLGAQSIVAHTAFEFLEADKFIPFTEAAIRVFDRYGEREKRFKARMKFLVKSLGPEKFLEIVNDEMTAVPEKSVPVEFWNWKEAALPVYGNQLNGSNSIDQPQFEIWKLSNTGIQKDGYYHYVQIKVRLGDIHATTAKRFSEIVKKYAADDIRITVNQGFLLRHVHPEALKPLFTELKKIGLADPGFGSILDVTACPGTDTCNLGVSNSTALSLELEKIVENRYPDLVYRKDIYVKISGCMNSCGQHMAAPIGFHGSSFKIDDRIAPAMQVLMGGGLNSKGQGFIGDRIIKLPTKRVPEALIAILDHYKDNHENGESFNDFYQRLGKKYFYDFLKPFGDTTDLTNSDFQDWGDDGEYVQAIGVGECAGASLDMVSTIMGDASDRLKSAYESYDEKEWGGSIYFSYSAMVIAAKALLLCEDIKCNTHAGIIRDFQENFVENNRIQSTGNFDELCMRIKTVESGEKFAGEYLEQADKIVSEMMQYRQKQLGSSAEDKKVISEYYKA